jgi:hypothetical protein
MRGVRFLRGEAIALRKQPKIISQDAMKWRIVRVAQLEFSGTDCFGGVIPSVAVFQAEQGISLATSAAFSWEIPRAAGENAALRDDPQDDGIPK